jgi:hypothetical protein
MIDPKARRGNRNPHVYLVQSREKANQLSTTVSPIYPGLSAASEHEVSTIHMDLIHMSSKIKRANARYP